MFINKYNNYYLCRVPSLVDVPSTGSPSSLANGSTIQLDSVAEDYVSVVANTPTTAETTFRLSYDAGFWHPNYLTPSKVDHPLHESIIKSILKTMGQCFVALFFGIPLMIIVLFFLTFVIPLRLLFYIVTRLSFRGIYHSILFKCHCYPLWPLSGKHCSGELRMHQNFENVLLMATLEGGLDPSDIRRMIWRKLVNSKDSSGYLNFPKLSQRRANGGWIQDEEFDINNHVKILRSQDEKRPIKGLKELEKFLADFYSEPLNPKKPLWRIYIVTDFGESQCTLIVFKVHVLLADRCFCPMKMLCFLNDEALRFDSEPHIRRDGALIPLFISFSMFFWRCLNICGSGLCDFITYSAHPLNTVWNLLEKQQKLSPRSINQNANQKITWARIPSADQLLRVERILRCTTEELLTSFVSGALRRFFKARGVRFPPSVRASIPVTFRDFMSISKGQNCDFALLPIKLPTDIEGVVPRVWESQRRMYSVVDSAFPRTSKCISFVANNLLPSSWTSKLIALPHRCCDGFICFYRSGGELSLSQRRIYSLLSYSSLTKPVGRNASKFGFTFVQIGHEIVLSLSADVVTFPDPDILVRYFQAELHSLLRLLAPRMLTLSQATFLPIPFLSRKSSKDNPDDDVAAETVPDANANVARRLKVSVETGRPEGDSDEISETESVEELENLLSTVQNELLQMESNPKGDRGDYIHKLAHLEEKMEAFHRSITSKLEKSGRSLPKTSDGKELDAKASWDTFLQPYKEDGNDINSDLTREGVIKHIRKRSKRLSSPTRLSRQNSREFIAEIP